MKAPKATTGRLLPNPKLMLREQLREVMRFLHYSGRTEASCWQWIVRFLRFHRQKADPGPTESRPTGGWRHPRNP